MWGGPIGVVGWLRYPVYLSNDGTRLPPVISAGISDSKVLSDSDCHLLEILMGQSSSPAIE